MGSKARTPQTTIAASGGSDGQGRPAVFRKLQAGLHGLSPDDVRADQRARLQAAMVHAVAERGYGEVTVADVLARAGVSRRTFYEHYADKHACFIATYDAIIAGWTARSLAAQRAAKGWRESLRAGLGAVFEQVVADPLGAQTVFVAALTAGGTALQRRSRAIAGFELHVRRSFERAPGGPNLRPAMVTVMVGGVRTVIENRLRDDRLAELPGLVDPLVAWMLGYRSAVATGILDGAVGVGRRVGGPSRRTADAAGAGAPGGRLPEMPLRLWQDERARPVLVRSPRERILDAVTDIVAFKGYGALSVAEICRVARTSRQTFNALFASREEAFLAAYDAGGQQTIDVSGAAYAAAPNWPAAVHQGLVAHTGFLAGHEAIARIGFLEVYSAGPEAVKRLDGALQVFRAGLEQAGQHVRRAMPPEVVSEAIGGGIFELMRSVVLHRGAAKLPSVLVDSTYAALAPYIGAKAAAVEATRA